MISTNTFIDTNLSGLYSLVTYELQFIIKHFYDILATYFSPVMTYLLADVGLLVGRFIITVLPVITVSMSYYWFTLTIL